METTWQIFDNWVYKGIEEVDVHRWDVFDKLNPFHSEIIEGQDKLKNRKQWEGLKPNLKSVKSTTYGQDYPLLNARIKIDKGEETLILAIAVNWYQSDTDFPFFTVWLDSEHTFSTLLRDYGWNEKYDAVDGKLHYHADPENYEPGDIIDGLLDEYLTALGSFE